MRTTRSRGLPAGLLSLGVAALALLASPSADARTSIVGRWADRPGACATTDVFAISPQGIATDDMSCHLPGVSRVGDVVTFEGRCENVGERPAPETVVATLRGERLDIAFQRGGGRFANLYRCPARR